jgi:uncharacterized membrane protein YgcG
VGWRVKGGNVIGLVACALLLCFSQHDPRAGAQQKPLRTYVIPTPWFTSPMHSFALAHAATLTYTCFVASIASFRRIPMKNIAAMPVDTLKVHEYDVFALRPLNMQEGNVTTFNELYTTICGLSVLCNEGKALNATTAGAAMGGGGGGAGGMSPTVSTGGGDGGGGGGGGDHCTSLLPCLV